MNQPPTGVPVCYRHPDRETHVSCQRCGRPICPDCMNPAAVGFQCPECVAEGRRTTRTGRSAFGGERSSRPELTSYVLIAVNVVVFALLSFTGRSNGTVGRALLLVPDGACRAGGQVYTSIGNASPTVSSCAAAGGDWVAGVASGAPWQLITSGFAHVGVLHLAFNMLALYFLGPQVEAMMGRLRFLALYGLSLLAGSVAVLWLSDPYSATLGASGAIFGLIGGLLIVVLKVKGNPQQLLLWLALNVVITVMGGSGISWQGHLGGFLGGVAAAAAIVLAPRERRGLIQGVGLGALFVVLVLLAGVRILQLG